MCNEWPTPFRFIPGNHDIGDNPPGPEFPAKHPLQPQLMDSFRRTFGSDYWATSADNWFLIELDAQLLIQLLTSARRRIE